MDVCRSCREPIHWLKQSKWDETLQLYVVVPRAKNNPINANPNEKGNLILNVAGGVYRFATADEKKLAERQGKNLYISHFSTCRFADRYRKEAQETAIMHSKRKQRDRANEALYGSMRQRGTKA